MAKKKKELSLYKKLLLVWIFALLLFSILCWVFVFLTMREYEKNQPETYINELIKDIKKTPEKYFEIKSEYEDKDYVKKILKNEKITYSIKKDEAYLCTKIKTCTKNDAFAIVTLDTSQKMQKLKMLNYSILSVKSVENATSTVKIYASSDAKLKINGIDISKDNLIKSTEIEELKEGYSYVTLPKMDYYEIEGFTITPEVTSEGNDVTFEDGAYYVNNYKKYDSLEKAGSSIKDSFSPLAFAEDWSKFLYAEYDMEAGRGLNRVAPNLIEETGLYKKAKAWATNVDITFTSVHTMDGFTGEEVSNITIYNENAFSADVYFEYNMTIAGTGKKVDVFNERIYFIYYDGAYRAISMKSITE